MSYGGGGAARGTKNQAAEFRHMSDTTPNVFAIETTCHALVGAGLGAFLAAGVIVANDAIFNLVMNSPSPHIAAAVFVGALSSQIAVGSAITGFILCSVERS